MDLFLTFSLYQMMSDFLFYLHSEVMQLKWAWRLHQKVGGSPKISSSMLLIMKVALDANGKVEPWVQMLHFSIKLTQSFKLPAPCESLFRKV